MNAEMIEVDTSRQNGDLIQSLAQDIQAALTPSILYLFDQAAIRAPGGECVMATIGGTIFAACEIVARIEFPAPKDAEGMLAHMHEMLDAGFASAMRSQTEGVA